MRIVFMGTPEFAVESLNILVENKYEVVGVVTMPDKPSGRGHKLQFSPVKQYALEHHLPVLQPEKLRDETFLKELKQLNADLQIVVAFRMLPEVVWNMPAFGTFNLHASLLPQYRGAAPINWAIINGEKETGATTFFLTHEIDTGKIILQEKIPVSETDNAGIVHDKLMVMGALMVKKTVDLLIEGKTNAIDQSQFIRPELVLKPAPKIFKETCEIDWNQPVEKIYNFIRGLSPNHTAWTNLYSYNMTPQLVKINSVEKIIDYKKHLYKGSIKVNKNNDLLITAKDGFIRVLEIQFPNKKILKVKDFLNGFSFKKDDSFEIDYKHIDFLILKSLYLSKKGKLIETIKKDILNSLNLNQSNFKYEKVFDEIESRIKKQSKANKKTYIEQKLFLKGKLKSKFIITIEGKNLYNKLQNKQRTK